MKNKIGHGFFELVCKWFGIWWLTTQFLQPINYCNPLVQVEESSREILHLKPFHELGIYKISTMKKSSFFMITICNHRTSCCSKTIENPKQPPILCQVGLRVCDCEAYHLACMRCDLGDCLSFFSISSPLRISSGKPLRRFFRERSHGPMKNHDWLVVSNIFYFP